MARWPGSCTTHDEVLKHLDFRFHDTAKKVCGSLIQIVDGRVQLCHHSAGQYLRLDSSKHGLNFDIEQGHARLAQLCLECLLLRDVAIPEPGVPGDESRYPLLGYALVHWPLHVYHSGETIHTYQGLLRSFLNAPNTKRIGACLRRWPFFREAFTLTGNAGPDVVVHALAFHGLLNVLKYTKMLSEGTASHQPLQRFILQLDTSIDARDGFGNTPLSYTAKDGSLETAKVLLDLGADVNAREADGYTALHLASWYGHQHLVELLLPKVSNIDSTSKSGLTPLLMTESIAVINMLLDAGANIEAKDDRGQTPLVLATFLRRYACMEILLDAGADLYAPDVFGLSAFDYAAAACASSSRMPRRKDKPEPLDMSRRRAMQHDFVRSSLLDMSKGIKNTVTPEHCQSLVDSSCRDSVFRGLLFLREHDLARTVLLASKRYSSRLICDLCDTHLSYKYEEFGVCTTCAWDLCRQCLSRYSEPRTLDDRLCEGHEMLMINESAWDDLEPKEDDTKSKQLVVLERWLAEMRQKFQVDEIGSFEGEDDREACQKPVVGT